MEVELDAGDWTGDGGIGEERGRGEATSGRPRIEVRIGDWEGVIEEVKKALSKY